MPQILLRFSLRIFQMLIFVLFFSLKKLTLVKSKKTGTEATSLDILTNRERGGTAEGTPVGVVNRGFAQNILSIRERGGTAEGTPVGAINRGFAQDILSNRERGGTAEGTPVGAVNKGFAQDILSKRGHS
jgi:hypothetical protein